MIEQTDDPQLQRLLTLVSPRVGFVRAIATGLQPMHFGFGQERLGGRRLYDVPKAMGYATEVRSETDLNLRPHPLA